MVKDQKKAGVLLSYIMIFANIGIQLIYTPLMLRLLGQSEYGIYTLSNSIISYLSLFDLGFSGAYLRFYSQYKIKKSQDDIARLNGTFLILLSALGMIAIIVGCQLSNHIDGVMNRSLSAEELETTRILLRILSVSLGVTLIANVFESIILAHEQYVFLKSLKLVKIVFSPFLAIPMMLMGYGSRAVAIATLTATAISFAADIWYCIKKIKIQVLVGKWDFRLLREIGGFSLFLFLNEIISQINWNVDKVLLGYYWGSAATAVYGVGAQIDVVYRSLSSSISSVFAPKVNRLVAKGNEDKALSELFSRIGRIQFIILFPVLIGVWVFGKYFIKIWAGEGYDDAYYIAMLLIVPVTVPLIQNLGIEIQRAKNKHQFRSIIYFIMAILNIVISIPLCRLFGGIGCAAGTAIGLVVANGFIMNWYYHKYLEIDIVQFWREIASFRKGIALPLFTAIFIKLFVHKWTITAFCGGIIAFLLVYVLSMWLWGINQKEKDVVLSIFARLKKQIS